MRTAWRSGVPGTWVPFAHRACPHNELDALQLRVLAPLPPEVFRDLGAGPRLIFRRLRSIARRFPGHKWSNLETAQSYEGSMRRKYLEVAKSLAEDSVNPAQDSKIDCFLKTEKVNPLAKFPKPRLIFPRQPRYNLEVASRLKPFEHWLWGYLTARRIWGGSNTRVVAKGLNPRQRANLIRKKLNNFVDGVCFEVDGKAFEAHVGPSQLRQEHSVYMSAYRGDGVLKALLGEQLVLRGRLPCGAKFSRPGGRASGDFNTGMGNSLVMLAVVSGVLREYGVSFDLLVDGDNALIFLDSEHLGRVTGTFAARVLASSGHELTLEKPARLLEGVRFGRSAPINLGGNRGYTMVRDYRSVLSGALSSHKWLREPKYSREWLTGVASCELSLAIGIPVLQAWASCILKSTGYTKRIRSDPFREYFIQGAHLAGLNEVREVDWVSRVSFERAFGLTVEAQIALEESFLGLDHELNWLRIDYGDLADLPPSIVNDFYDEYA